MLPAGALWLCPGRSAQHHRVVGQRHGRRRRPLRQHHGGAAAGGVRHACAALFLRRARGGAAHTPLDGQRDVGAPGGRLPGAGAAGAQRHGARHLGLRQPGGAWAFGGAQGGQRLGYRVLHPAPPARTRSLPRSPPGPRPPVQRRWHAPGPRHARTTPHRADHSPAAAALLAAPQVRAKALLLQPGARVLQLLEASPSLSWVRLRALGGWSINASSLLLRPEDPTLPFRALHSCLSQVSACVGGKGWLRCVPGPGKPRSSNGVLHSCLSQVSIRAPRPACSGSRPGPTRELRTWRRRPPRLASRCARCICEHWCSPVDCWCCCGWWTHRRAAACRPLWTSSWTR